MTKFRIILITLITILALALPAVADLTFYESYENYDIGAKNFWDKNDPYDWRPSLQSANYYEIVGNPTRSGNKAMKFYNYRASTTNGYRTEHIAWTGHNAGRARIFTIGEEHWLGLSIYLPADYVCDGCESKVYNDEIHMQIYGYPDRDSRRRPGYEDEAYHHPSTGFLIRQDKWMVIIRSDSNPVTPFPIYEKVKSYVIGSWLEDRGKWTDWVFHFKLDYTKNGENGGFFKIYKNGALVVNDTGGNCFNDLWGPYFHIGTYKYSWKDGPTDTDERIVYFDEVKVGDKNSNFSEVSPRDLTQPALIRPNSPVGLRISPVQ